MVLVRVAVVVPMIVLVVLMMAVALFMGVAMFVLVIVGMRVCMTVCGMGTLPGDHIDLRHGNAAAHDFAGLEARSNVQRCRSLLENFEREATVDHCAEQHVAADSGEAIKVCNLHRM